MIEAPTLRLDALAPFAFVAIGSMVVLMGEVLLSRSKAMTNAPSADVRIGTILSFVSAASSTILLTRSGMLGTS